MFVFCESISWHEHHIMGLCAINALTCNDFQLNLLLIVFVYESVRLSVCRLVGLSTISSSIGMAYYNEDTSFCECVSVSFLYAALSFVGGRRPRTFNERRLCCVDVVVLFFFGVLVKQLRVTIFVSLPWILNGLLWKQKENCLTKGCRKSTHVLHKKQWIIFPELLLVGVVSEQIHDKL